MSLEKYFDKYRKHIIGIDESFESPFGIQKMIYADWTASGRMFRPIEEKMLNDFGPYVANTHTDTGIEQVKQMLLNGYVLNIPTYINSWQWQTQQNLFKYEFLHLRVPAFRLCLLQVY